MKSPSQFATLAIALACAHAAAQTTIFDQNFDGGYTGAFSTNAYGGGSPSSVSLTLPSSGGNPAGCMQISMTTTTSGDYYAGQAQFETISGNTDANPADYVLAFDAYGSQAAPIQFTIQMWSGENYGGSQEINATVQDVLNAANTWQTFNVNLANVTSLSPTGGTWQLNFQ